MEQSLETNRAAPRGISPKILMDQVRNTAPYVFETDCPIPYRAWLQGALFAPESPLNHFEYFRLCLSSHHATVASFVPTDVDNQIRSALWHSSLPDDTIYEMSNLVLESLKWDFTPVSTRWVKSPSRGTTLSGHQGEWFSTAAGAYGALRKRDPDRAAEMAGAILGEVQSEADLFAEFRKARDGIGMLKTSTVIAHNLGDLDRVMDLWNLPADDALRLAVYKAGHELKSPGWESLIQAGILNKAYMADENHRHFALRTPKCLRKSADFLLPIGPFLDGWGAKIARHPGLEPKEIAEIVEALVDGWTKLRVAVGYTRALSGILEAFPGGFSKLSNSLPARIVRTLKAGELRTQIAIPRQRFEEQWRQMALRRLTETGPWKN